MVDFIYLIVDHPLIVVFFLWSLLDLNEGLRALVQSAMDQNGPGERLLSNYVSL